MKTRQQELAKKLAAYSLGLGGATFAATCADADIIFTNFTGTATVGNDLDLDIDQDGTADFTITMGTRGPNAYATYSFYNAIVGATANAGAFGYNFDNQFGDAFNLPQGVTIDSNLVSTQYYENFYNFPLNLQFAYTNFLQDQSFGGFAAPNSGGYLGIRFDDNTGTARFGWIRVDITGGAANGLDDVAINVNGFAYAVDESIQAGQIPEPSSATAIGLLALGALGLRRRRESSAA